jgi:MOSC domain-containing protein YiiM
VHRSLEELEAGLPRILESPPDRGPLELIVCRPAVDERKVLFRAQLDRRDGLVGDGWRKRGSPRTPDGSAHPEKQLTLMNARVIALLAGDPERWPLAGDQLYVDLDLSAANLPPGTQLGIGDARIEITPSPHTGCKKFVHRFGVDALKFVNSPTGRERNLRGIYARVLRSGTIRVGDEVKKLSPAEADPRDSD